MAALFGKLKEMVGFTDPMDAIEDDYAELDGRDYRDLYERDRPSSEYAPLDSAARRRRWDRDRESASNDFKTRTPSRPLRDRPMPVSHLDSNKVIDMPGVQNLQGEVLLVNPRSFDEMAEVIKHLRDRKSVVMNLTLMDPADAQRSVDFVAGGTYAIDGHQERIGENIFLFTPNCIAVTTPTTTGQQDTISTPEPTPIERPLDFSANNPVWAAAANG
ncbi:cell division protein SepF [Synechococcus sp. PCC 7336]|uniref:cell division protein SepF n=1 Tax=Synechococcus sp. PCC 7336 TaxID=195250 RepID=UPI00034C2CDE